MSPNNMREQRKEVAYTPAQQTFKNLITLLILVAGVYWFYQYIKNDFNRDSALKQIEYGASLLQEGDLDGAYAEFSEALERLEEEDGEEAMLGRAQALGNIGNVHLQRGDYARALDYHQQFIEVFEEWEGEKIFDYWFLGISGYMNVGLVQNNLGLWERALENTSEGLRLLEILETGDVYNNLSIVQRVRVDPHVHGAKYNLLTNSGLILRNMGRYSDAIPFYKQALELFDGNARQNQNLVSHVHTQLGLTYLESQEYELAVSHIMEGGNQLAIARLYLQQGKIDAAIAILEAGLSELDAEGDSSLRFGYHTALGYALAEVGDTNQSIAHFEAAEAINEATLGSLSSEMIASFMEAKVFGFPRKAPKEELAAVK
jgi:tetratricopeptide (TPR) repeat protein